MCLPYPSACPIQDSGPIVPHFSPLLKPIHSAHSVYQVFNPFMTRFALPMKFYSLEFHSVNPLSCLWLSHSLAHIPNFQTLITSPFNCLFFLECIRSFFLSTYDPTFHPFSWQPVFNPMSFSPTHSKIIRFLYSCALIKERTPVNKYIYIFVRYIYIYIYI